MEHGFVVRTAASVVTLLLAVSGCSSSADVPVVSAADLQRGLVDRLAETDTPSTWVHCPKDLVGEVGAFTRCDVTFSQDNTVAAVLTTTQVNGDDITWEITQPELTREQVEGRVASLTSGQSVTCDSGLDGRPGDWVQCEVTRNGTKLAQTVEVKDVVGLLSVDLALTAMVPQEQLEESVATKVAPNYGRLPDKVVCDGGLPGSVGAAVKCVVTIGHTPERYVATVTSVSGGYVDFQAARPRPSTEQGPGVDMCRGCPG